MMRWARQSRRGSTYVLVLGAAVLVTVVGLSASAITRSQARSAAVSRDWTKATAGARSGIDLATYVVNSVPGWRARVNASATYGPLRVGDGELQLTFLDEIDGLVGNNETDPVRVFARMQEGEATRYFSGVLEPGGRDVAAFLSTAVHAGTGLTVQSGTATVTGAPASANGTALISIGATLVGDVEAAAITRLGTVTGTSTSGAASKALPNAAMWNELAAVATPIAWSSIPSGTIEKVALTAGSNPYGTANASGVYRIVVPALSTLTIKNCRIEATLLLDLSASSNVRTTQGVLWDPANGGVAMVARTSLLSAISLGNADSSLREADQNANFNPAGSPFLGVSNATKLDSYPVRLRGLFVVHGSGTLTLESGVTIHGTAVCDTSVTLANGSRVLYDRGLLSAPPKWFLGPLKMQLSAGTIRWETEASFKAAQVAAATLAGTGTSGTGGAAIDTTSGPTK